MKIIIFIISFFISCSVYSSDRYPPLEELQKQVKALGITSQRNYKKMYKKIKGAPSHPDQVYPHWPGWPTFLGTTHLQKFLPYEELQKQVQALGIKSKKEYEQRFKDIKGAPSTPHRYYKDKWKGWPAFLGTTHLQKFLPYKELKKQVQKEGIQTSRQYQQEYNKIKGAPSHPPKIYGSQWEGWKKFLGKVFLPYKELQKQVQKEDIQTSRQYQQEYNKIKGAPATPHQIYGPQWEGWKKFLGKEFLPLEELTKQVQEKGIQTSRQYQQERDEFKGRAPATPSQVYSNWPGWPAFLGTTHLQKFLPLEELQKQVQALGITTRKKYQQRRGEIKGGAPYNPDTYYKAQWPGWKKFLDKKFLPYEELKTQARALDIQSAEEYRKRYKEIKGAPAHPNIYYKDKWTNWPAFLGTNKNCREVFKKK